MAKLCPQCKQRKCKVFKNGKPAKLCDTCLYEQNERQKRCLKKRRKRERVIESAGCAPMTASKEPEPCWHCRYKDLVASGQLPRAPDVRRPAFDPFERQYAAARCRSSASAVGVSRKRGRTDDSL